MKTPQTFELRIIISIVKKTEIAPFYVSNVNKTDLKSVTFLIVCISI